ncbi:hypothetical protein GGP41_009808 [Bipolaris sorokiniana]|uniref:Uncharacterized protein n=1 Tax=Cochliobolus sativus TaxID=45130 RepID=A0A8H5ZJ40_COCSA|nr:hypothetical protein GGP41_009808 [Bipolaris sorokiniana]
MPVCGQRPSIYTVVLYTYTLNWLCFHVVAVGNCALTWASHAWAPCPHTHTTLCLAAPRLALPCRARSLACLASCVVFRRVATRANAPGPCYPLLDPRPWRPPSRSSASSARRTS